MRHSPSVEPSTQPSPSLHPKLQRALGCFDTRLDDELARYRRQRAGRSVPPIDGLRRKQAATQVDLMSFAAASDERVNQETGDDRAPSAPPILSAESIPLRHDAVDREPELSSLAVISGDRDDSPTSLSYSLQDSEANHDLTDASTPPDDYLESSEELLRSLAREEAQVQVERGFLESLMTPLGVGAMLMLLLSSAMFGYVIMNPSSLKGLSQVFARRETPSPAPIATQEPQGDISNTPPLDAKEFVDLGLGNLTTLKTRSTSGLPQNGKPSPSPSVLPSKAPVAAPKASQPTVAAPSAPSPASVSAESAPVRSAPVIRPNPAPVVPSYPRSSYIPAPTIRRFVPVAPLPTVPIPRPQPPIERTPAPSPKADYHVDTPYDNDRTYDKIQQSNAGAEFVNTPEGGFIRSGSYRSEAEAKAKVEELQNQGIPAEVRK